MFWLNLPSKGGSIFAPASTRAKNTDKDPISFKTP